MNPQIHLKELYLDSVALITDHFEDIAETLALRYAEMVQYPGQEYVKVDLTSILDKTFFSAFTHTFTPLIYAWSDIDEISEEFPAIPDLVIQHLIPNPATSEVTIRLTGEDGNGISIREVYLYDLTGRAVYHSDMLSQDIILNVSEYNSGIYLTKVIDAFGRATYDKLMIVR